MYKVEMDLKEIGWMGGRGLDPNRLGRGPGVGCCEHGVARSGSIKCGEVLD